MKHLLRLAAVAVLAVTFVLPAPQVAEAGGYECFVCHRDCLDTYEACTVYCQPVCTF